MELAVHMLEASKSFSHRACVWLPNVGGTPGDERDGTLVIETGKTSKVGNVRTTEYYFVQERFPQIGVNSRQFWINKERQEKFKNGETEVFVEPVRADEIYLVTVGSHRNCTCDGGRMAKVCKHLDAMIAVLAAGEIPLNPNLRPEGGAE